MARDAEFQLDRFARIPAKHALFYTRTLNAPIETVWPFLTTCDGLSDWWIAPVTTFELRPGGAFVHHWTNTVRDVKHHRFIDIEEPAGRYAGTGGMRFEVSEAPEGQTTFSLLTTFGPDVAATGDAPQPHGPGTAWPDVAAGWHSTADALERIFLDKNLPTHSEAELLTYYRSFLAHQFRLIDMVRRT
ncbi:MAG: SRPBCC domain-containing protein [Pseudomonadota bacterium]